MDVVRSFRTPVVLVPLLVLAGCKGPTEYEPEDYPGAILPSESTHVTTCIEPRQRYKGAVEMEMKSVSGGNEKDELWIGKAVRKRIGAFRNCYEKRVQDDPDLRGEVVFVLAFDGEGALGEARFVEGGMDDPKTVDCLQEKLSSIFELKRLEGGESSYEVVMTFDRVDTASP